MTPRNNIRGGGNQRVRLSLGRSGPMGSLRPSATSRHGGGTSGASTPAQYTFDSDEEMGEPDNEDDEDDGDDENGGNGDAEEVSSEAGSGSSDEGELTPAFIKHMQAQGYTDQNPVPKPPKPGNYSMFDEAYMPKAMGSLWARNEDFKKTPEGEFEAPKFKDSGVMSAWGVMLLDIPTLPDVIDQQVGAHQLTWWRMQGLHFKDIAMRVPVDRRTQRRFDDAAKGGPRKLLEEQKRELGKMENNFSMRTQRWRNLTCRVYDFRDRNLVEDMTEGELRDRYAKGSVHPLQLLYNTVWELDQTGHGQALIKQKSGRIHYANDPGELPPNLHKFYNLVLRLKTPKMADEPELWKMYLDGYNPYNVNNGTPWEVDPSWTLDY